MATFLAERYWPGVTPAAARAVTEALDGGAVRVLETIVTEADEVCFWYVEADAVADVAATFAAAGVVVHRVAPAERTSQGR